MRRDYANNFQLDTGLFSVLVKKKMVWNAKIQPRRTVKFYYRCHVLQFRRQRTSSLQSFQCVGSVILVKERWAMYDSRQ